MKIAVIGAGGWGTALSDVLAYKNHHVILWSHESDVISTISVNQENEKYLPGIQLHNTIHATTNLDEIDSAELFVLAVPTQFIRDVIVKNNLSLKDKIVVNVAKGIEAGSLLRISEILEETINLTSDNYVILTGPSHAEEVGRKMPTTVVAASKSESASQLTQKIFSNNYFRVYSSHDVIGCELGGALKNVVAIAAGIIDGLGLGDNTKAALITRGLAEMSRLGIYLGADPQTFSGLSGLGDLFVTCNSKHSRNRYVGEQIGKGRKLNDILEEMNMIAEGVTTTKSAYSLTQKHKVEMPIIEQVHRILFENLDPTKAIYELMTRKFRHELF